MSPPLLEPLLRRAREKGVLSLSASADAATLIRAVKAIPYGRATNREPTSLLQEWRGTCSGKHYLLQAVLAELGLQFQLIHRVYRISRVDAERLFPAAASTVKADGLTDVHTFGTLDLDGRRIVVDVTFPGSWDGRSNMALACGDGLDVVVPPGTDAQTLKEDLISKHCLPAEREPFIAALTQT